MASTIPRSFPDDPGHIPAGLSEALARRYRLLGKAGHGGMARVWVARDLKHDREVVLKAVHAAQLEPETTRRFLREIDLVARLNHPHIVPLLDSGQAGEWLWFVMPRFTDGSLADRMRRAPALAAVEALRLAGEVADALAYAHARGIVHRDVKPQNVLLAGGHALLADFGLALARSRDSSFTPSGTVLGTPTYMSPEQAAARRDVDGRTDQYSLACVLYEMLAGRPPFDGAPELQSWRHQSEEPAPLETMRPDAPWTVARALQRALSKAPEDRFADMSAFRDAFLTPVTGVVPAVAPAAIAPARASADAFVGREADLWACGRALEAARWLTVTGPGGVGKTRLARVLADRLAPHHPAGVVFVDMAGLAREDAVTAAVAGALGDRAGGAGQIAPRGAGLLVLDNAEHLRDAARDAATMFLARNREWRVLVTSRVALGAPAERVHPLAPLSLPGKASGLALADLASSEAARLFLARAAIARPSFSPDDRDAARIARICRQLDGLPLALELAAARLRMLSLAELDERLEDRMRLLTAVATGSSRHGTLEAAIRWSDELLGDADRRLLRALSVFRGGAALDAVTAVCGDGIGDDVATLDALTRLAEHSLLVVEPRRDGPTRYRLLETIREYAFRRLAEDPAAAAAAADRHLAFYHGFAERADAQFFTATQTHALNDLAREHDNLLAALARAHEPPHPAEIELKLATRLYRLWYTHGHLALAREAFDRALGRADVDTSSKGFENACYARGGIALLLGDLAECRRRYETCLARALATEDRVALARSRMGMGLVSAAEGRDAEALEHYRGCLELYRELGDRGRLSIALHNLAELHVAHGRLAEACETYRECAGSARESGNRTMLASSLADLGTVLARMGGSEAARVLDEAIRLAIELDSRVALLDALDGAAALALRRGDVAFAMSLVPAIEGARGRLGIPRERIWREAHARLLGRLRRRTQEQDRAHAAEAVARQSLEDTARVALEWLARPGAPRRRRASAVSPDTTRRSP